MEKMERAEGRHFKMKVLSKKTESGKILPGRIVTDAVGKNGPSISGKMTVGFADYRAEAGPMEPHNHAEECVYIILSEKGFLKYGNASDQLDKSIPLEAGMLLHIPPLEWHAFEYEEGGCVEILFIYGQVDNIRPEETQVAEQ
jgi:mannose-6-phosphate isomerase-like protein (cupin superfamily)